MIRTKSNRLISFRLNLPEILLLNSNEGINSKMVRWLEINYFKCFNLSIKIRVARKIRFSVIFIKIELHRLFKLKN